MVARENIEIVRRMLAFFHHGDAESEREEALKAAGLPE